MAEDEPRMLGDANPLTGMNSRGFFAGFPPRAYDRALVEGMIKKALPVGYSLVSFRYVAKGAPYDTIVSVIIHEPGGDVDHQIRVRQSDDARPWGNTVPITISRYLKKKYEGL